LITGGNFSTRPSGYLNTLPLRHHFAVRRLIPTSLAACDSDTPSLINLANASRLA
jgi:hypothetical protein